MKYLIVCSEQEVKQYLRDHKRRREILIMTEKPDPGPLDIRLEAENIAEILLMKSQGKWIWGNAQRVDLYGNQMPLKLACCGDDAVNDKDLKKVWPPYLKKLSNEHKVICIEAEVGVLPWTQNQKAHFIGLDKSDYSRMVGELKKKFSIPNSDSQTKTRRKISQKS